MSEKEALLEKYGGQKYPKLIPPVKSTSAEPGEYRALVEHKQRAGSNPRFRIIDRKEISYGCGYAYLLGWMYTPPDLLTIQTTTHVFTIEGKNLDKIEFALMDEKLRELHEYNPELHSVPEDGEPIIERLEIKSRWEEKV